MVAESAASSGMYPVIQHTAPNTATALQCMSLSSINAFRNFFEALLQSINVKISLGPKIRKNVNQPRGTLQQQTNRSVARARSAGCADSSKKVRWIEPCVCFRRECPWEPRGVRLFTPRVTVAGHLCTVEVSQSAESVRVSLGVPLVTSL